MTTLPGGTTPFDSTGFAPVTSTSVVLAVRTTPAPSTAPAQIRTPSTTIAREPMNASSSTITGAAFGGRRDTPPPPPPAREVPPRPDLRARAHGRPGVHHAALPDAGADVHVARHQDDALLEEAPVPGDPRRHHAHRSEDHTS